MIFQRVGIPPTSDIWAKLCVYIPLITGQMRKLTREILGYIVGHGNVAMFRIQFADALGVGSIDADMKIQVAVSLGSCIFKKMCFEE